MHGFKGCFQPPVQSSFGCYDGVDTVLKAVLWDGFKGRFTGCDTVSERLFIACYTALSTKGACWDRSCCIAMQT